MDNQFLTRSYWENKVKFFESECDRLGVYGGPWSRLYHARDVLANGYCHYQIWVVASPKKRATLKREALTNDRT